MPTAMSPSINTTLLNSLIVTTDALEDEKQYFYDGEGDRTEVVDEDGHASSYTYDIRQRLITVTDALGGAFPVYVRRQRQQVDYNSPNNHTTNYAYDLQNRLIRVTDPIFDLRHQLHIRPRWRHANGF